MKMNFKNLRKNVLNIGLTATLACGFLAANKSNASLKPAPNQDGIHFNIKDLKAKWAAQEQSLTAEQKVFWKAMTKDKRFKNILPRFLEQLDISRIKKMSSGNIIVPFTGKEDVALSWRPGMNDYYVMTTKESMVDNIIPAHEMSPFMADKLDCFFIPQPGDVNLSNSEKEIIQTLDKCLNNMYAFVYARPTANIDKEALMNGDYAGMVWDSHCTTTPSRGWNRLNEKEQKEYAKMLKKHLITKCFSYQNVGDIKADYPAFTKNFSDQENEFYMSLGYPYSTKDLAKMGAKFTITGGCTGEMLLSSSFGSAQGVSWVYKPTAEMAEQTLHQYKERKKYDILAFCNGKEEGFKESIFLKHNIDVKNLKNITPFQKALVKRYEIAKEYNKKIVQYVNKTREVPKSLAHEGLLNQELQNNFNRLHAPQKVGSFTGNTSALDQKNQPSRRERDN